MAVAPAARVPVHSGLDGRDVADRSPGVWVRHAISCVLTWVEGAVGSYVLLALLQLRVIWGDWKLRDLTTGDTSAYFQNAARWADQGLVDIIWSPLYTSYFGTLLKLTDDVPTALWLHRTLITFAVALMVLAAMRELILKVAAWFVAAWWTTLESAFAVHYEVHLFALLPLLIAIVLIAKVRGAWGRSLALGVFALASVLVRNEYVVATCLLGAACLVWEVRALRSSAGERRGAYLARHLAIYAAPLMVVMALGVFFYSRTIVKYPEILVHMQPKHTVNICQVYAVGYQQRYNDWGLSPWTECQDLMQRQFGAPTPSLFAALRSNPAPMIEHFVWNTTLLPNGLQVSLFNAMSGTVTPDYGPVPRSDLRVPILSLIVVAVVVAGVALFVSRRGAWARRWVAARPWPWLTLLASVCVTMLVIPVERPRPEYIYPLTLLIMAIVGLSAALLCAELPSRVRSVRWLVPVLMLIPLLLVPSYYDNPSHVRPRNLLADYEALKPFASLIEQPSTVFLKGDYAGEIVAYVGKGRSKALSYDVLRQYDGVQGLDAFLADRGVTLFFVNQRIFDQLQAAVGAQALLADPTSVGWSVLGQQRTAGRSWMLLQRTGAPSTPPTATPGGLRASAAGAVLMPASDIAEIQRADGLLIGSGWHPPQTDGGVASRLIGNGAEVVVTAASGTRNRIVFDLSTEPDLAGRSLKLAISDHTGVRGATELTPGRQVAVVAAPIEAGRSTVLRLGLVDAQSNAPVDPTTVQTRVFGMRWEES